MEVLLKNSPDYVDVLQYPNCEINCIHIKIKNLAGLVGTMSAEIADTSWIRNLDGLSQIQYQATSVRTIDRIVNDIFSKVVNGLNTDIGEYLVSYCAQSALVSHYHHAKIPLAELLKEKIIGNPGFDFHTISTKRFIVFGEAKFSMENTPRAIALSQISEFIALSKDHAEIGTLRAFLDEETESNMLKGIKGYAAAFSFNAKNIDTIFRNALADDRIKDIAKHNELFLIAIEIC